jgi:phospholipid/cholesterol/gamma-HCH transport system substrate-binding protein
MTPNRERMWVGLFVIVAATVLLLTAIAIWGGYGRFGVSHRAYFKFSGGVQPGTPVRYGGMRVGAVRQVRIDPDDSTRIEVEIVVDRGTPLKVNSIAKIASLGPLSDSYIEVSTGTADAALLEPDTVMNSTESLGLAQLGDTIQSLLPQIHQVLDKLTLTLDGLQATLARGDDLMNDRNRSNLAQALAGANDLLNDRNRSNLSQSLDNLNQMVSESRPKIAAGLTGVTDAAAKLTALLDDIKKTSVRADEVLSSLDTLVTENRQDVRSAVTELRAVLKNSAETLDQLQYIMTQNSANVYDILENLRSSAVNLRNTTETIKSSPSALIRGINAKDRKPGGPQK